jgi:hypothetical protein
MLAADSWYMHQRCVTQRIMTQRSMTQRSMTQRSMSHCALSARVSLRLAGAAKEQAFTTLDMRIETHHYMSILRRSILRIHILYDHSLDSWDIETSGTPQCAPSAMRPPTMAKDNLECSLDIPERSLSIPERSLNIPNVP